MKLHTLKREAGFSIIELVIAIGILALVVGLGVPNFRDMLTNLRVRSTAESLLGALQLSRSEGIRTNGIVIFQLMSSLENSCVVDTNGKFWVASLCPAEGACGSTADRNQQRPIAGCAGDALILAKGPLEGSEITEITLSNGVVCFSGLGRINPAGTNCPAGSMDPLTSGGAVSMLVKNTDNVCTHEGGDVRCLQIDIGPGGESRMCDPAVSDSNDPRKC